MGREGIRWGEYGTANRFTYHNPPIESSRKEKNGRPQPTILQEERGWPGAFTAEESDAGAGAAADADAEAGADLAELIGRDLRQLPEKPLLAPSAAASLHLLHHRLPSLRAARPSSARVEGGVLSLILI